MSKRSLLGCNAIAVCGEGFAKRMVPARDLGRCWDSHFENGAAIVWTVCDVGLRMLQMGENEK